jgi:hypothetical protein
MIWAPVSFTPSSWDRPADKKPADLPGLCAGASFLEAGEGLTKEEGLEARSHSDEGPGALAGYSPVSACRKRSLAFVSVRDLNGLRCVRL